MTLLAFLALGSLNFGNPGIPLSRILTLYHKADGLFNLPNSTPVDDSEALAGFEKEIAELQKYPDFSDKDTLLFQSWMKKGALFDVKYNYTGAKEAYCRALRFNNENDSWGSEACIYAGISDYSVSNMESATTF